MSESNKEEISKNNNISKDKTINTNEGNNSDNISKTSLENKIKLDKKTIIIIILSLIIVIGFIMKIAKPKEQYWDDYYNNIFEEIIEETIIEHNVKIHIDFTENLIFSRYDVLLELGNKEERITHGENKDFEFLLEEGTYTLYFINADNSNIKEEITLEINNDVEIGYKIICYSDKISVTNLYTDFDTEIAEDEVEIKNDKSEFKYKNYKDVIKTLEELGFTNIVEKPMYDIVLGWTEEGEVDNVTINGSDTYKRGDIFKKETEVIVSYHLSADSDPSKNIENTKANSTNQTNENKSNTELNQVDETKSNVETKQDTYNYYTTNNNETAKKGNTGKFSYVKKNSSYNVYWLIDFDNGYVYNFTEGNGDDSCEKIKIKSGNLNDGLELSYKNSNNAWAKYIHFKYKNQPHQLVIVDNDYFDYEYSTTSLESVLEMIENKIIFEP